MTEKSTIKTDAAPVRSQSASTPRPSVIQLAIKEASALYAAYIPIFTSGGLFIPTTRDYKLGDPVYVLISLPDDPQRYPVAGRVAWVTPARAVSSRIQGVGVVFPDDEKARALKLRLKKKSPAYLPAFCFAVQSAASVITSAWWLANRGGAACAPQFRCSGNNRRPGRWVKTPAPRKSSALQTCWSASRHQSG